MPYIIDFPYPVRKCLCRTRNSVELPAKAVRRKKMHIIQDTCLGFNDSNSIVATAFTTVAENPSVATELAIHTKAEKINYQW